MMNGGYMLPEFGVAYIKDVRFFRGDKDCKTDLIVAACKYLKFKKIEKENFISTIFRL